MSYRGNRARVVLCFVVGALLIAACSAKTTTEATNADSTGGSGSTGSAPPTGVATTGPPPTGTLTAANATIVGPPKQAGVQHLDFTFGPLTIAPGQNEITFSGPDVAKPAVDGYIVAIYPNLLRSDGSVPPVDIIHLHHGVWVNLSGKDPTAPLPERFFASGEEKTTMIVPPGYGYPFKTSDKWLINYMLHNLLSTPDEVSITYSMDFIPASDPAAKNIKPVRPIWMDVQNGSTYPVFDSLKNAGKDGLFTYPDDATDPYQGGKAKNEWTVDKDTVLIATGGHLHPGGLYTDLYVKRSGATASAEAAPSVKGDKAHLFRSEAVYYEPAGAVSWDVALTVTQPDWMVSVKKGDVLSTTTTYDSARASWYESMGIMVMWAYDGGTNGRDPFQTKVDSRGNLTHGHLAENDNHGDQPTPKFVDMTKLPNGVAAETVTIADFAYAPGDMSGIYTDVPIVKPGGAMKFINQDAPLERGIWHTITACKAPCNQTTGGAYPLADGDVTFDSGQLGKVGVPTSGFLEWSVPKTIPPGTYTYFCRVHPSMRGAFRVTDGNPGDAAK